MRTSRFTLALLAVLLAPIAAVAAPVRPAAPPTLKELRDQRRILHERILETDRLLALNHRQLKQVRSGAERDLVRDRILALNQDMAMLRQVQLGVLRELERRERPVPPPVPPGRAKR